MSKERPIDFNLPAIKKEFQKQGQNPSYGILVSYRVGLVPEGKRFILRQEFGDDDVKVYTDFLVQADCIVRNGNTRKRTYARDWTPEGNADPRCSLCHWHHTCAMRDKNLGQMVKEKHEVTLRKDEKGKGK